MSGINTLSLKRREIFALILWGGIFTCILLVVEYLWGDTWESYYMPARLTMMEGYLEDVSKNIFPRIQESGNSDHAIGFYILAAFVGEKLNFNAEQIFRAFTLLLAISMLIYLMFFIYYYYGNFTLALITPILGYLCFEDYLFRAKQDVYVAVGIWMVVLSFPLFILLLENRRSIVIYIILVFVVSFSNIAREHTSLGVLLCFVICGLKDILSCIRTRNIKQAWRMGFILCAGVCGYSFCSSTLANLLLELNGQEKWLTASTAWHNIYIGFGYFKNPYGIEYLDECAAAAVNAMDSSIVYASNAYYVACKNLVFDLVGRDFIFCVTSLIKKFIWSVGGIGIVVLRRVARIIMVVFGLRYIIKKFDLASLQKYIYSIILFLIVLMVGIIPSVLTAPYIQYSITSYAMVVMSILWIFMRIIHEEFLEKR